MPLEVIWSAGDVSDRVDRFIRVEVIEQRADAGLLITCESPAARREGVVMISIADALAFAQVISDRFGPVSMPRRD
jgi:hypothetical protein